MLNLSLKYYFEIDNCKILDLEEICGIVFVFFHWWLFSSIHSLSLMTFLL